MIQLKDNGWYLLSAYYVPATMLRNLYLLNHLFLHTPIFQMRKHRFRDVMHMTSVTHCEAMVWNQEEKPSFLTNSVSFHNESN